GLDAVARGRRHLPREGLLAGALDSEGDVTVRHDVPAGYLDLETGHSRMRPGQVLFVTVRQGDDEPLGILELAALTPFDDDARALLESLAPSLAYALVAAMGREDYMRRHRQAG
ncbi:GAF domain-containing protein, partial [Alloalcanivorax gelatiniphagus]